MAKHARYLIDSSVLMQAHRRYYKFGVRPGFWECLVWHHKRGAVISIDRVKREIDEGKDALRHWTRNDCPASFFESTNGKGVGGRYGEIITWANAQHRYRPEALAEFATVADGWLVAFAGEHGLTVVTREVAAPESKNEVKIPDVCEAFKVPSIDSFEMLEHLKARFTWKP